MIDYYAILNIEHNATKKEIKTAFKKEALKWHPDRNSSPEATARMQLINEAYLILKDDEARLRYDKQYEKFKQAARQEQTNWENYSKEQTSRNNQTNWENYSIDDDILNNWIKKAKQQAKEMLMMSVEDLVGMSRAATNAAWEKTKVMILIVIIANIILYAIYN